MVEIAFLVLFIANVALIVLRTPHLGATAAHDLRHPPASRNTETEEGDDA